jgi:hypothetical protein
VGEAAMELLGALRWALRSLEFAEVVRGAIPKRTVLLLQGPAVRSKAP